MFFKIGIFLKNYNNQMSHKEILLSWVSELWIFILNLRYTSFALIISYIYMYVSGSVFRIANKGPDAESSWIGIRIHNTGTKKKFDIILSTAHQKWGGSFHGLG